MKAPIILNALGRLLLVNAGVLVIPLLLSIADALGLGGAAASLQGLQGAAGTSTEPARAAGEFIAGGVWEIAGFLVAAIMSAATGWAMLGASGRSPGIQLVREGFAIATFGWIAIAAFGAIPFMVYFGSLSGTPWYGDPARAMADGFFESMSGFSTTGSTILTDIEAMPRGILLWRSLTHWLGGMGIVTLALAIFPALGISGYQMFRGEVPGPTADRLQPRLAETAKVLWGVYGLFTAVETVLLWLGGMNPFESLCHALATMATGGFSTRNASVAAYGSAYIEWVIIGFMFLAGMNFMIHFRVLRGKFDDLLHNAEFHMYAAIVVASTALCAFTLGHQGVIGKAEAASHYTVPAQSAEEVSSHLAQESSRIRNLHDRVRHSAFQVLAVTTTTGFATADFDVWPHVTRFCLVLLMFFGGCAGSTSGGMKMIRVMVTAKAAVRELKTIAQPRLVAPVRVGGEIVDRARVGNMVVFLATFLILLAFFSAIMCLYIPDTTTAVTSVIAAMGNIGPGLSGVGASRNFSWIPIPGKAVLSFCMLLGRLELFTVLILFLPGTWRK